STLTQSVNKAGTTVVLTSDANPSTFGQPVTFVATASASSPGTGTPAGTVTFKDGLTTLGTSSLSAGQASLSLSTLVGGSPSITATYNGDSGFNANSSSPLIQSVVPASTTTTLAPSSNPSIYGQTVVFTVTVAANAPGLGVPTGSVLLKDGSATIGGGTLVA